MTETPVINPDPTPKQKFHTNPTFVAAHNRMVESQEFDLSCDIALMEYQRLLVALGQNEVNLNAAAVAHIKITGAMEYLKTLKGLGLKFTIPAAKQTGNMQHKK